MAVRNLPPPAERAGARVTIHVPSGLVVALIATIVLVAGGFFYTLQSVNQRLASLTQMMTTLTEMDAKLSQTNRELQASNHKLDATNSSLDVSVQSGYSGNQQLAITNKGIEDMGRQLKVLTAEINDLTDRVKRSHLLRL